jgi:hypothetical protein
MINYEQFELLFENWQAMQKSTHLLEEKHPTKRYHNNLLTKIKILPASKISEYFDKYFNKVNNNN